MTREQLGVLAQSTAAVAQAQGVPLMGIVLIQSDGETVVVENCANNDARAELIACLIDAADHFLPAESDPAEDPKHWTDEA